MTSRMKTLASILPGQCREMSEQQSRFFIDCYLWERSRHTVTNAEEIEKEAATSVEAIPFRMKVLIGRLRTAPELKYSMPVVCFLADSSTNVGHVVMWAHFLVQETRKLKPGEVFSMEKLTDTFPMGFPTDDAMSEFWDQQKLRRMGLPQEGIGDNYIDTAEAWS